MRRRGGHRARNGDFLRICDRSGFTVWASDTVREWNGLIVRKDLSEQRHPQDFVRSIRDDSRIPGARPEPVAVAVGPLITETTEAANAGSTGLVVLHTERMEAGDHVGVYLSSGDLHRSVIQEVTDLTHLVLISALPGPVASGALVVNYTAIATA